MHNIFSDHCLRVFHIAVPNFEEYNVDSCFIIFAVRLVLIFTEYVQYITNFIFKWKIEYMKWNAVYLRRNIWHLTHNRPFVNFGICQKSHNGRSSVFMYYFIDFNYSGNQKLKEVKKILIKSHKWSRRKWKGLRNVGYMILK